ncbi:putative antirepressor [Lactobacillus phage c5]|uniref:Antirepressor n=1 Tax=Lactobacillus phage c5 TaxID=2892341 RepID=F8J196_9CAUD|nr:anti-repressor Ant [Lactobacillus phage c5]ACA63334.1 putative antirepressor [Lactobacillus phage c5]
MNEIQAFNFEGNQVRTVEINNEPWFVGKDVAQILGYSNPSKALKDHVDDEDKLNNESLVSLGQRGGWIINESGLYSLILSSKLPTAKAFKRWVTSKVLPAIRKHGAYMTDQKAFDVVHNKNGLIDLLQQAADQLREKDVQIEEMKPKALFADSVSASDSMILIRDLAKILNGNGIDIGGNRLFQWLRDNGYLISNVSDRNMPTQKAMNLGLFKVKETSIVRNKNVIVNKTTMVTGKGQQYFVNKFLKMKNTGEYLNEFQENVVITKEDY